jgi:hypothetical protein
MTLAPTGLDEALVPDADIISLRATTEPGAQLPIRLPDTPALATTGGHSTEVHP